MADGFGFGHKCANIYLLSFIFNFQVDMSGIIDLLINPTYIMHHLISQVIQFELHPRYFYYD